MAAVGFGGRYIARTMPQLAKRAEEVTLMGWCISHVKSYTIFFRPTPK